MKLELAANPADRAGERHAGRRLRSIDDVVAVDRGDRHRRGGLGHRHGLGRTRRVAVGIGDRRRYRRGAVGERRGITGRNRRAPGGAGSVDGGGIELGHAVVGDRHGKARVGGNPADRAAQRHAGCRLGMVDHVGAVDRGDRHRRTGLGHRHGLAGGGRIAVAIGDQPAMVAVPLASVVASLEGIVALQLVPAPFTVAT